MNTTIIFNINWNVKDTIPKQHRTLLKEHGRERAIKMSDEGFTEGELVCSINNDVGDKATGYTGYWTSKTNTQG